MTDDSEDKWAFSNRIEILSPCFGRIADAIKLRYLSVTGSRPQNAVPAQLAAIIETSFAASLRKEEQRPIQFQLVCAHPDHSARWGEQAPGLDWDFGYTSDMELTAENIRKLSAALDHESSAILVWDGESKPIIRGIVRFKKTGAPREPHRQQHIFTSERAIRITATSPGAITFDSCEYLLGEFVDGLLTHPQALEVFERDFSVFGQLISGFANTAFQKLPEYLQGNEHFRFQREWPELYTTTLQVIVHTMRRTRCGGTLIITNSDDVAAYTEHLGYALSNQPASGTNGMPTVPMRMQQYYSSLQEADEFALVKQYGAMDVHNALIFASGKFEQVFLDHSELMRAARFVGQLTAADGAVILKPDLSVHTFGAKLKTGGRATCRRVTNLADVKLRNRDIEQAALEEYEKPRGMRFKSALSYAGSDPEAIVFVASVDGPVSVLGNINQEVLIGDPMSFAPITLW